MTVRIASRLAFTLAICALGACQSLPPRLRVVAAPPQADVSVKNATGTELASGKGTVVVDATFQKDSSIVVQATRAGYSDLARTITPKDYAELPTAADDDSVRELRVDLAREFQDLCELVVAYDATLGFVGRLRSSRAFRSENDTGGKAPALIYRLPEGAGIKGMDISADGKRLLYSEVVPDAQAKSFVDACRERPGIPIRRSNIKSIQVDGGGGIQFVTQGDHQDYDPTFDATGESVIFASNRRGKGRLDLLSTRFDVRTAISDVYLPASAQLCSVPSASRDGSMAFSAVPQQQAQNARPEVWIMRDRLPSSLYPGVEPRIAPDGQSIAYVSDEDLNLYVTGFDGSHNTSLTSDGRDLVHRYLTSLSAEESAVTPAKLVRPYSNPAWSADGKWIACSAMASEDPTGRLNQDIYIFPSNGGRGTQVTSNGSADLNPVFSPDGRYVYFVSNRGGSWAIWRIETETAASKSARS